MIELRNVTKYYAAPGGRRYILKNVSLTIPSRTNLAVIGPNGAGKSTLLRIIGGAESPNEGRILTEASISWPLGLSSGFQGSLTGRKNVEFVCNINGLSRSQISQVIRHVTEFAEIGNYFDMPVGTYSSGMRARLNFGLSTAFDFDIYLIDELTSVGDTIFRDKAKAAFEKIRERASLVFVSHNVNTLREACDSALFLRDGKAQFYPDIEKGIDAYQEYILERSIAGQKLAPADAMMAKKAARKLAQKEAPALAKKAARKVAKKAAVKSAGPRNPTPEPPQKPTS